MMFHHATAPRLPSVLPPFCSSCRCGVAATTGPAATAGQGAEPEAEFPAARSATTVQIGASRGPENVGPDGSVAPGGPSDAVDAATTPGPRRTSGRRSKRAAPASSTSPSRSQADAGRARRSPPYVYGVNNGGQAAAQHAPHRAQRRQPAHGVQLGEQRLERRQRLHVRERRLPVQRRRLAEQQRPGTYLKQSSIRPSPRARRRSSRCRSSTTSSADKSPAGTCATAASNYLSTRFKQNKVKGCNLRTRPTRPTPSSTRTRWSTGWRRRSPNATVLYLLDNEPDLWSSTHAEVHPNAVTYAELAQRNIEFAKAVKTVSPGAQVSGRSTTGGTGYVNLQAASDSKTDGDFLSWWLGQMKSAAHELGQAASSTGWTCTGTPRSATAATQGRATTAASTPIRRPSMPRTVHAAGQRRGAQREQAPRSLWDTTYIENSWIRRDRSGTRPSSSSRSCRRRSPRTTRR